MAQVTQLGPMALPMRKRLAFAAKAEATVALGTRKRAQVEIPASPDLYEPGDYARVFWDDASGTIDWANAISGTLDLFPRTLPPLPEVLEDFVSGSEIGDWDQPHELAGDELMGSEVWDANLRRWQSVVLDFGVYKFGVRVYDFYGNVAAGDPTLEVSRQINSVPTAPTKLKADSWASNILTLSWTKSSSFPGNSTIERYNIYRSTQRATLEYGAPFATANDPTVTVTVSHADDTIFWYAIRAENDAGSEQNNSAVIQVRVASAALKPLPNSPGGLTATVESNEKIRLEWFYNPAGEAVSPAVFNIYHNAGFGDINYGIIRTFVTYTAGAIGFTKTPPALWTDGTLIKLAVRAESAAGDSDQNKNEVIAIADSTEPPVLAEFTVAEVVAS